MNYIKSLSIIFLLLTTFSLQAHEKNLVAISIEVSGVCGMCEERIENALDVKGVKKADYTVDTHMCEIVYDADKISEEEIHKLLNEAGHDTEKSIATDEQYDKVHSCCKYREHDDH